MGIPDDRKWAGRYALEIEFATACVQLLAGNVPRLNPRLALPPALSTSTLVSVSGSIPRGFSARSAMLAPQ
jgi:hypothetical protein